MIMVGTGRAAELGVLFRRADALQSLSSVQTVAFDKTGTLTKGRLELTDLTVTDGFEEADVLRLVASVEATSEHPIATAVLRRAEQYGLSLAPVEAFNSVKGYGVRAVIEGRKVLVGADRFMAREGISLDGVRDAINAAPALTHADVGVAIDTGTNFAIEAADVVLMSGDLEGVVNTLHIIRRSMRNICQNLFWAFGYNALLIPVVAGVFCSLFGSMLSPALADGAMAMSSVFVLS